MQVSVNCMYLQWFGRLDTLGSQFMHAISCAMTGTASCYISFCWEWNKCYIPATGNLDKTAADPFLTRLIIRALAGGGSVRFLLLTPVAFHFSKVNTAPPASQPCRARCRWEGLSAFPQVP